MSSAAASNVSAAAAAAAGLARVVDDEVAKVAELLARVHQRQLELQLAGLAVNAAAPPHPQFFVSLKKHCEVPRCMTLLPTVDMLSANNQFPRVWRHGVCEVHEGELLYEGEINAEHKPHGFGMATNRTGDIRQVGLWQDGAYCPKFRRGVPLEWMRVSIERQRIPSQYLAAKATLLYPNGDYYCGQVDAHFIPHGTGIMFDANGTKLRSGKWMSGGPEMLAPEVAFQLVELMCCARLSVQNQQTLQAIKHAKNIKQSYFNKFHGCTETSALAVLKYIIDTILAKKQPSQARALST